MRSRESGAGGERAAEDARWMREALGLAAEGCGRTRPNPPVGAVLVRDGVAVGRGWHRKAGGPHAEVWALEEAGEAARGATLYVTLEPCCTWGRTPPCAEAVIKAGVRRVVMATTDPNPKHAGRAVPMLREAGIEVACGVEEVAAKELIAAFRTRMTEGRPRFVLKLGMTWDGRIADAEGRSKWITAAEAREAVQGLRRASDVILVGAGTVRADRPSLWPRPDGGREPWRAVVAGRGAVPTDAPLFCDEHADRTVVFAPKGWQPEVAGTLRRQGVSVVEWGEEGAWAAVAGHFQAAGALQVLCEGGGTTAAGLMRSGMLDEVHLFVAAAALGGDGKPALGAGGWRMGGLAEFEWKGVERVGADLHAVLTPKGRGREG